jgi:hypothetical protein
VAAKSQTRAAPIIKVNNVYNNDEQQRNTMPRDTSVIVALVVAPVVVIMVDEVSVDV